MNKLTIIPGANAGSELVQQVLAELALANPGKGPFAAIVEHGVHGLSKLDVNLPGVDNAGAIASRIAINKNNGVAMASEFPKICSDDFDGLTGTAGQQIFSWGAGSDGTAASGCVTGSTNSLAAAQWQLAQAADVLSGTKSLSLIDVKNTFDIFGGGTWNHSMFGAWRVTASELGLVTINGFRLKTTYKLNAAGDNGDHRWSMEITAPWIDFDVWVENAPVLFASDEFSNWHYFPGIEPNLTDTGISNTDEITLEMFVEPTGNYRLLVNGTQVDSGLASITPKIAVRGVMFKGDRYTTNANHTNRGITMDDYELEVTSGILV